MTEGEKKFLIEFVELLIRDAKCDSLNSVLEIIDKHESFCTKNDIKTWKTSLDIIRREVVELHDKIILGKKESRDAS